jgi:DNA polymerase-1
MIELINPATGRLHADFRQIGAPTGRFACTNPNIQQVPHAVEYRRCFSGHPEGRKLIIADYSQIELRILAEFSGDQGFISAFNSGADLHRVTAAEVFNVPLDQVSKEQRDFAKRLNFGVVYGIGAQRFSIMTGLSVADAENVLRKYFANSILICTKPPTVPFAIVRPAPPQDVWCDFALTKRTASRFP